ncbi:MAG: enoyl-CoA hydratase/isomerase family protein [Neomegalonema sp.]
MTNELLYEITDGVGRITFNRPDQRNALTYSMYEGLAELCANAPTDGSVKAIIVSGAGDRAFAAGTDMTQFRAFAEPQDALDYEAKMDRVLEAVERCPIPTIAAITGACTGGGAASAAACDLRISDARLKFGFPIARTLGNCLSINNLNRLSVLLGPGRMREILFTARLIEAEEAQQIGLVSEVLTDAADLRRRADELAALVADHAPLTLRATKEGLRRRRVEGPGADGSDLIVGAYMSADFKEGMEAFLGKRKPTWTGK